MNYYKILNTLTADLADNLTILINSPPNYSRTTVPTSLRILVLSCNYGKS